MMITQLEFKLADYVTRIGEIGRAQSFCLKASKEELIGKPRPRWEDIIKTNLIEGETEWTDVAQDKDWGRVLMNLQVIFKDRSLVTN
jgi:hypothetical protein